MTDVILTPGASIVLHLPGGDLELTPEAGTVTLDASWAPYVQASVTVPHQPGLAEAVDPALQLRATLTATLNGDTRTFELGVRGRRLDDTERTLTITLASDEALLQDYRQLTGKVPALADDQWELPTLINNVLTEVLGPGVVLELSPMLGASVYPRWEQDNLFVDPGCAGSGAAFGEGSGITAGSLVSSTAVGGANGGVCIRATVAAAGEANVVFHNGPKGFPQVQPGRTYWVGCRTRSSASAKQARIVIRWYDAQGVLLRGDFGPTTTNIPTTHWAMEASLSTKAPKGAAYMSPYLQYVNASAGQFIYVDAVLITEQPVAPSGKKWTPAERLWTGSEPANADYTSAWEGTANSSISTLVPLVPLEPDALYWGAGVSAWDYLTPLLEHHFRRLYCDEAGRWYLVPAAHTVDGDVAMTVATMTDSADELTRDGEDAYADGVAVRFTWETARSGSVERWDTAGSAGRVVTVERQRPLIVGTAAFILESLQRRARRGTYTAPGVLTATPGQQLQVTRPNGDVLAGQVGAVSFDLPTGYMTVTGIDMATL